LFEHYIIKHWPKFHPDIPLHNKRNGGGGTLGLRANKKDSEGKEIHCPDKEGHVVFYFVHKLHSDPGSDTDADTSE
jgi:hypothetical protein